jgi:hypothetical protein
MRSLTYMFRCARKPGFSILLLVGALTLGTTPGFSSGSNSETIQATVTQGDHTINLTLTIDNFSSPADLQILSQAFQEGQDRALVVALSKTKAVGHCSIAGTLSYDIAFIQMIATPTGRQITFITNRPLQGDEPNSNTTEQSFDLAIGRFELNDADMTKSTGFLYPAARLVIDEMGEFHYDLAGTPWSLANVLDSKASSGETIALGVQK